MAVVGVDIGDHTTHISVARLGAVETISNDYSLRATPSIVAFGERQRYMGVAADNQRNLNPRNTVSHFKNTMGQAFNDSHLKTVASRCGANVIKNADGKLLFEVMSDKTYTPEQTMAMLFTKVKHLVAAAVGENEIETCVVSVPIYFSQAQRAALHEAAHIAGLRVNQVISDTSALCISYGKNMMEQVVAAAATAPADDQQRMAQRNVVLVDIGHHGTQAVMGSFSTSGQGTAKVLASSHSQLAGGKDFDEALLQHAITTIQQKYNQSITSDNMKARNKLRAALERAKKQMSANTSPIPVQIDALINDTDIQFTVTRAEFEEMPETKRVVREIRETLENLLASTTIRPADIHAIEIVGGTTRIPIVKQIIKEVFSTETAPSTTLNADEAVSRGCALHAATLSAKFITRKFHVDECVHHGVEAVVVQQAKVSGAAGDNRGQPPQQHHEKVLVCDEGDSMLEEKIFEIGVTAGGSAFPINVALQYVDTSAFDTKLFSLYRVDAADTNKEQTGTAGGQNVSAAGGGVLNLTFSYDNVGCLWLREACLVSEERPKKRRTSECQDDDDQEMMVPCRTMLAVTRTMPQTSSTYIDAMVAAEAAMVSADSAEICRQEEKNRLEEQLYNYKHQVTDKSEHVSNEEAYVSLLSHFDEVESWLYEPEGEQASAANYQQILATLQNKMKVYSFWLDKFMQKRAREEEKRRFMAGQPVAQINNVSANNNVHMQQQQQQQPRQIPVVYEGGDVYVPRTASAQQPQQPPQQQQQRSHSANSHHQPTRMAHKRDPFPREPFPRFGRSPFFDSGEMFGW